MKSGSVWWEWAALAVFAIILYVADKKHMATIHYNTFLLMLIGLVAAMVLFFKYGPSKPSNDEIPESEEP